MQNVEGITGSEQLTIFSSHFFRQLLWHKEITFKALQKTCESNESFLDGILGSSQDWFLVVYCGKKIGDYVKLTLYLVHNCDRHLRVKLKGGNTHGS